MLHAHKIIIVKLYITGLKSVEGTKWICYTCDANLKKKLSCPVVQKPIKKMDFPKKIDTTRREANFTTYPIHANL